MSASKRIFCALKTVSALTARTLMEVMKERLCFMKSTLQSTCNRQLMQQLTGPLGLLALGPLRYPEKEKAPNCFSVSEPKIHQFT